MKTHLILMTNPAVAERLKRELQSAGVRSVHIVTPNNLNQIQGMEYCSAEILENYPEKYISPREVDLVQSRVRAQSKVTM